MIRHHCIFHCRYTYAFRSMTSWTHLFAAGGTISPIPYCTCLKVVVHAQGRRKVSSNFRVIYAHALFMYYAHERGKASCIHTKLDSFCASASRYNELYLNPF